jgi:hypothetical protein
VVAGPNYGHTTEVSGSFSCGNWAPRKRICYDGSKCVVDNSITCQNCMAMEDDEYIGDPIQREEEALAAWVNYKEGLSETGPEEDKPDYHTSDGHTPSACYGCSIAGRSDQCNLCIHGFGA